MLTIRMLLGCIQMPTQNTGSSKNGLKLYLGSVTVVMPVLCVLSLSQHVVCVGIPHDRVHGDTRRIES